MKPRVITPPAIEPVTLDEVKLQCKIDGSAEDSLLSLYIAAAREYFEDATQYTIYQQTLEVVYDRFWRERYSYPGCQYYGVMELPRATPLVSITSVKYLDGNGVEQVWASTNYRVDVDSIPGRIILEPTSSWPNPSWDRPFNALRIRYVAGQPVSSPVTAAPSAIKLPILMLVAGMYENRESETFTDRASVEAKAMQYGVDAFIRRLRDQIYASSY